MLLLVIISYVMGFATLEAAQKRGGLNTARQGAIDFYYARRFKKESLTIICGFYVRGANQAF